METAGRLVNSYEFSDPSILRATYRAPRDLLGWDMASEGRFLVLRLLMGVRVTADTGRVEFRIIGHSRQAPIPNPVLRLGFRLFARRTQLRFYRRALRRYSACTPSSSTTMR